MKSTYVIIIVILVLGGIYFLTNKSNRTEEVVNTTSESKMSFFIASTNPGVGGNLGGLAGADMYCKTLAESVGVQGKTWHAYLSAKATPTTAAVNARDRIGAGPWYNVKGELIAATLADLHSENNLNKSTALTEKGETVSGRGDAVNIHDILTGSNADGTLLAAVTDTTCSNWTSSTTGAARVGHHDRMGVDESAPMKSWNSSHDSRGCSLENLKSTGGGGLFYCFAE